MRCLSRNAPSGASDSRVSLRNCSSLTGMAIVAVWYDAVASGFEDGSLRQRMTLRESSAAAVTLPCRKTQSLASDLAVRNGCGLLSRRSGTDRREP